jgi:hypothetical protein
MVDRVGGVATRLAGNPGGPGPLGIFQLPGDNATEADLEVLKQLPSVVDLALAGPAFGDATAPHILQLPKLATIRLRGRTFTDQIMEALLPHPCLRILILEDVAIGAKGFAALGKSRTIEYLDVVHVALSPEAFVGLRELRGFREIKFRDCQLDEADVAKLRELLPECDVLVETADDKGASG